MHKAAKAGIATVTKRGRGSRTSSDRPPPGAVNLERSYEICRAVIQNSPNRHQLKAQLRPPPSLLAKNVQVTSSATAQGTTVTKFIKTLPTDEQTTTTTVATAAPGAAATPPATAAAKTNKVVIKVCAIPIGIETVMGVFMSDG